MSKTVLITGGTGLVGSRLTALLRQKGYQVRYLSRSPEKVDDIEAFSWDIKAQTMDSKALEGTDYIVHLAGAGVADQRWTAERKKAILESRTKSSALLRETLRSHNHGIKAFISASAIGYYGFDTGTQLLSEDAAPGSDFLADVTRAWEHEVEQIADLGIRTAMIRVGIVLSDKGGALEEISKPVKFGVGAPLGDGDQYMSWIHIDDLCNMFIHAIEADEASGPYNGVAPEPVTNREFTKTLASTLNRPMFMPAVPAFALKLMVGEMANMLLGGNKVSSKKIESEGFNFKYPKLKTAMESLLK